MDRKLLRNIGIIAHVDAGKTTVTERILYYSGETHKVGEVHDGNTHTDFSPEERKHGITIFSAATSVFWNGYKLNLIDTPGHIDFNIEVNRSLRVLDGAIVVFDAVAGVEPQSETNWRLADKYHVPRICFINKMDRIGADFFRTVQMIEKRLAVTALVTHLPLGVEHQFRGCIDLLEMQSLIWNSDEINTPIERTTIPSDLVNLATEYRQRLIDKAAEQNEEAQLKYINGEELETQLIHECIRKGTLSGAFVPVLCGSALKNKGIQPLMDAVVNYLPAPVDTPPIVLDEKKIEIRPDEKEPFTGLAFKIVNDKHGDLTFIRVYSGSLTHGSILINAGNGEKERISHIYEIHADKKVEMQEARAGDIVAFSGLRHTNTGDTLCHSKRIIALERITVPEPVIEMAIEAKTLHDQDQLIKVLQSFVHEDPSLHLKQDSESGQMIISGMGELQLQMTLERLLTGYNLQTRVGNPQVAYRETITERAQITHLHKKQTGGAGQYAEVTLLLEPQERGKGIEFVNAIAAGAIPKQFIPGVESGVRHALQSGLLGGYPCVDIKVTLSDGRYHEQDSSPKVFEIAAMAGIKKGLALAKPKLLEPIMNIEDVTPQEYIGECIGDINRRRGHIISQISRGNTMVLEANVPLAEMFGYIGDLRAMTSGRASFTMEFNYYSIVPEEIAVEVLAR